jgi:hypothetical protein
MSPSWFQHADLMNVTIGALFLTVIWFMIRTLRKIDENQTNLFNRMSIVEKDLYELRGEHQAIQGRCKP